MTSDCRPDILQVPQVHTVTQLYLRLLRDSKGLMPDGKLPVSGLNISGIDFQSDWVRRFEALIQYDPKNIDLLLRTRHATTLQTNWHRIRDAIVSIRESDQDGRPHVVTQKELEDLTEGEDDLFNLVVALQSSLGLMRIMSSEAICTAEDLNKRPHSSELKPYLKNMQSIVWVYARMGGDEHGNLPSDKMPKGGLDLSRFNLGSPAVQRYEELIDYHHAAYREETATQLQINWHHIRNAMFRLMTDDGSPVTLYRIGRMAENNSAVSSIIISVSSTLGVLDLLAAEIAEEERLAREAANKMVTEGPVGGDGFVETLSAFGDRVGNELVQVGDDIVTLLEDSWKEIVGALSAFAVGAFSFSRIRAWWQSRQAIRDAIKASDVGLDAVAQNEGVNESESVIPLTKRSVTPGPRKTYPRFEDLVKDYNPASAQEKMMQTLQEAKESGEAVIVYSRQLNREYIVGTVQSISADTLDQDKSKFYVKFKEAFMQEGEGTHGPRDVAESFDGATVTQVDVDSIISVRRPNEDLSRDFIHEHMANPQITDQGIMMSEARGQEVGVLMNLDDPRLKAYWDSHIEPLRDALAEGRMTEQQVVSQLFFEIRDYQAPDILRHEAEGEHSMILLGDFFARPDRRLKPYIFQLAMQSLNIQSRLHQGTVQSMSGTHTYGRVYPAGGGRMLVDLMMERPYSVQDDPIAITYVDNDKRAALENLPEGYQAKVTMRAMERMQQEGLDPRLVDLHVRLHSIVEEDEPISWEHVEKLRMGQLEFHLMFPGEVKDTSVVQSVAAYGRLSPAERLQEQRLGIEAYDALDPTSRAWLRHISHDYFQGAFEREYLAHFYAARWLLTDVGGEGDHPYGSIKTDADRQAVLAKLLPAIQRGISRGITQGAEESVPPGTEPQDFRVEGSDVGRHDLPAIPIVEKVAVEAQIKQLYSTLQQDRYTAVVSALADDVVKAVARLSEHEMAEYFHPDFSSFEELPRGVAPIDLVHKIVTDRVAVLSQQHEFSSLPSSKIRGEGEFARDQLRSASVHRGIYGQLIEQAFAETEKMSRRGK